MSFFQNPSFYLQTAESDIAAWFKKAETAFEGLEQDFLNVLQWVAANAGEIGALITGLLGVASVAGAPVVIPTALTTALSLLNQGVAAVNAAENAATAQQANGGTVTAQTVAALAAGYALLKQAQISALSVASSTASPAPAPTPAS